MLSRICRVQIRPKKRVLYTIDHTNYAVPTRQHELDRTDHTDPTDHTDQDFPNRVLPRASCGGNSKRVRSKTVCRTQKLTNYTFIYLDTAPKRRRSYRVERISLADTRTSVLRSNFLVLRCALSPEVRDKNGAPLSYSYVRQQSLKQEVIGTRIVRK